MVAGIPDKEDLAGVMMTQYSLNQGLKRFGEQGNTDFRKEMQQIYERRVMGLKDPSKMSRKEKAGALKYLMFFIKTRRIDKRA